MPGLQARLSPPINPATPHQSHPAPAPGCLAPGAPAARSPLPRGPWPGRGPLRPDRSAACDRAQSCRYSCRVAFRHPPARPRPLAGGSTHQWSGLVYPGVRYEALASLDPATPRRGISEAPARHGSYRRKAAMPRARLRRSASSDAPSDEASAQPPVADIMRYGPEARSLRNDRYAVHASPRMSFSPA